ncbi:2-dehydropantoate 2-reductase [Nocardioides dongxiaopingii]|uniref:2-dehydropantoate 2-reductase n=1 Tax=Nocardioides sp. S-1144 TaxID=2582905 RepID=UPI001162BFF3|nr:2-dehydropantoate 2-reductase [Nocardioides sp. S-1144]QDH11170.1 2-dehydropantoate 2-reductase [Nocardioides sp. S-1144]
MRVCIVGAGAIGGWIGTRLAASGAAEVSALARGATLGALRTHGWRLDQDGVRTTAPARVSESTADLGEQDVVVLTVKATALAAVVDRLEPLLGADTVVLPFLNGVPWWFTHGSDLGSLESVDPGGRVAAAVPFERVLGGVVHASCAAVEPGLVRHHLGNGLIVGEPGGGASARVDAVAGVLGAAGFDVTSSTDVRRDAWYKLWGNMTMNPVTALTGATGDRVLDDPLVRGLCSSAMLEAQRIGDLVGCPVRETPEDRHVVTSRLGALRTSMLLDVEAGRPLELDALIGAVHELGRRLDVPTPAVDAIFGLTRLFGRVHGLYPDEPT